jgi:type IV pilus assembly protein PilO
LEFLLFRPAGEVNKGFYAEIPVNIEVQGGYHNLGMFFDKVARLSRIVNVSDIKIKKKGSKGGGGTLKATCVATTYRFVEEAKKGSKRKGKKK